MNGLGVVASGAREINTGNQFDSYYPSRKPKETTITLGTSYDTLNLMVEKIQQDHKEAAKIAKKLYSANREIFARNIFNHIYNNFQYKQDPKNREQVKGVSASYALRKSGIDCDDMAFLTGAILYNFGIPFSIRKISKSATGDYSHVYIVVPKSDGANLSTRDNYYVIDPVLDKFDFEYPKNNLPKYYDEVIVNPKNITAMNGITCDCGTMQGITEYALDTKNGWVELRANIINGVEQVPNGESPEDFISKVDLLIESWDDPDKREYVIALLIVDEEFGSLGLGGDGIFKKVFNGVKKVAGKVAQGVKKVFPATLLAREGIKVWFRVLGKKKAAAIWPGRYSQQQAQNAKIDLNDWKKRKDSYDKVEKIFKTIGGDPKKFAEAVSDGAKKVIGDKSWFIDFKYVMNPPSSSKSNVPKVKSTDQIRNVSYNTSRGSASSIKRNDPKQQQYLAQYKKYKDLADKYRGNGRLRSQFIAAVNAANKYAALAGQPKLSTTTSSNTSPIPTRTIFNPGNSGSKDPAEIAKMKAKAAQKVDPNALKLYTRYKASAKTYEIKGNKTLANRYVEYANRYAEKAGQPKLPLITTVTDPRSLTKGPRTTSSTTSSSTVSSRDREAALKSYNNYKSRYITYKNAKSYTAANRYASLANQYADRAGQPKLDANLKSVIGATSRPIVTGGRPPQTTSSKKPTPSKKTSSYVRPTTSKTSSINIPIASRARTALRGIEEAEYLVGMGEPATAAAATAAAAPFIVKIVDLLKGLSENPIVNGIVQNIGNDKEDTKNNLVKAVGNKLSDLTKDKPLLNKAVNKITSSVTKKTSSSSSSASSLALSRYNSYKQKYDMYKAKNDAIRANTYANYANKYADQAGKPHLTKLSVTVPAPPVVKENITREVMNNTLPTPPQKAIPAATNSDIQDAKVLQPEVISSQSVKQLEIGGLTQKELIMAGIGVVAVGGLIYAVSSKKGSTQPVYHQPAPVRPNPSPAPMNGPKRKKTKSKKSKNTTIVI